MDAVSYLRFAAALVVVLALLLALAYAVRRWGGKLTGLPLANAGRRGRLSVIETRTVDVRTKLVLVRRDAVEHLLLITPNNAMTVETGIVATPPSPETR